MRHRLVNIEKGKVVTLIGPSGAGKTTLLRMLNWLEMPTQERTHWPGKPYVPAKILTKI